MRSRGYVLAVSLAAVAVVTSCRNTLVGESCSHSGQCSGGQICVNMECTTGTAGYKPTGKVCITTECRNAMDCRGTQTCTAGACVCTTDNDCPFGRCIGSACVECAGDADCRLDEHCDRGTCQPKCIDAFDCPNFFACSAGKCGFVGCTQDKECAVALQDVRGKCDVTAKTCFVPCAGDTECGSLTGNWRGLVCADGRCKSVGCETDAECQLFLPQGRFGTCTTAP